jgi:hypothetical protein
MHAGCCVERRVPGHQKSVPYLVEDGDMERIREDIDGIPVILVCPDGRAEGDVVLWMSHLGGSGEQTVPMLERFAAADHPRSVSTRSATEAAGRATPGPSPMRFSRLFAGCGRSSV